MKLRYLILEATTDAAGAATVNATRPINGQLYAVEWVIGTLTTGVDATLTEQSTPSGVARTLLTLTNADANALYYPRYLAHSETGVALDTEGDEQRTMAYLIGTPRLVVASGGDTKTGSMILYYLAD